MIHRPRSARTRDARRRAGLYATALALVATATAVQAQSWPQKPVRLVAAYPPGSGPDAVMRIVGDRLQKAWGQQLVIENRPTGNGVIALETVKRSPPDGYNFLLADDAHLAAHPFLYKSLPYDTTKDFEPVAMVYRTYFFFVVPSDSPWKNTNDLVAEAKRRDGRMTAGSWGIGSIGHIGIARFEALTGAKFTHVPFQGTTMVYPAVGNKEVDWAFGSVASSMSSFKAGKVKYLAAAAPSRIVGFPDIPTMAETGGQSGFDVGGWVVIMGPRGLPPAVVQRINADVTKALADAEVKEKMNALGFEPWAQTPAQVVEQLQAASKRYADIVPKAKISLD